MNVKCDCGETRKNHPGDGCCTLNACTWFHPNIKYIRKFQNRAEEEHQTRRTVTAEIAGEAPVGSANFNPSVIQR